MRKNALVTRLSFVVCYQTRVARKVGETRVTVPVCPGMFYEQPESAVRKAEKAAVSIVTKRYPWRIPTAVFTA